MPEGDTIFRTAVNMRAATAGKIVRHVQSRDRLAGVADLVDRQLTDVEARGKHLLMHFDHGHVLHSHMGMTGSWHLYQPGEPWRKPARRAALSLEFDLAVGVCFSPKLLELLTAAAVRRHRYLRQLGPDILGHSFDREEVLQRLGRLALRPVGEAIMNQTVLCGIGNVYKSEVLFLARVSPFRPVANLERPTLVHIVDLARELMQKNLQGYPRRTRFAADAPRLWVYGRQGEPCLECGAAVRMRRQGELGRSTYWCPACQV